jgi:hypothetical protein
MAAGFGTKVLPAGTKVLQDLPYCQPVTTQYKLDTMSPHSSQINRPVKRLVKRSPSPKAEAKGEGTRPIPLDEHLEDSGFGKGVNYFIALADKLLGNKPKPH